MSSLIPASRNFTMGTSLGSPGVVSWYQGNVCSRVEHGTSRRFLRLAWRSLQERGGEERRPSDCASDSTATHDNHRPFQLDTRSITFREKNEREEEVGVSQNITSYDCKLMYQTIGSLLFPSRSVLLQNTTEKYCRGRKANLLPVPFHSWRPVFYVRRDKTRRRGSSFGADSRRCGCHSVEQDAGKEVEGGKEVELRGVSKMPCQVRERR